LQKHTNGIVMQHDNDIIYIGPSWAVQSYSTPLGDDGDGNTINIGDMFAKEFNHTFGKNKQAWLPSHGIGNLTAVHRIKSFIKIKKPIIWVLCDPIARLYYIKDTKHMCWPSYKEDEIVYENINSATWVDTFFKNPNWLKQRNKLLHADLQDMNSLGYPIGILGSHSDITHEDVKEYENLTVIEPSWQNVLCEHVGIKGMSPNLGADFLHQTLKIYVKLEEIENHIKKYDLDKYSWIPSKRTRQLMTMVMDPIIKWKGSMIPESNIESSIIDYINEQYEVWKQLEDKGLFNWVHPSIEGNMIFYEHVKHKMENFVNAHKE